MSTKFRRFYNEPVWKLTRLVIMERDGFKCTICGKPGTAADPLQVDHIVPLADGGSPYDPSNLRTIHRSANSARSAQRTNRLRRTGRLKGASDAFSD